MAQNQNQSRDHSSGSSHRGGGRKGGPENSKRTDEKSGPGSGPSTSPAKDGQYDPQRDPYYTSVARPIYDDFTHLESVINNPALGAGFVPSRGAVDEGHFDTGAARHSFGGGGGSSSNIDAPQARQVHGMSHQSFGYDRSEPYNAVGYTRVDGQVYDPSEVYEEYRRYGLDEEFNDNGSGDWQILRSDASSH